MKRRAMLIIMESSWTGKFTRFSGLFLCKFVFSYGLLIVVLLVLIGISRIKPKVFLKGLKPVASARRKEEMNSGTRMGKRALAFCRRFPESKSAPRAFWAEINDGTAYHGWQVQKRDVTVAETLEKALSTVLNHPVKCTGAGRTDAGVHAEAKV